VGTNVGAGLLTRTRETFLAGESEWPRVIGEVGPVLGLAFILFRIVLTWHLLTKALAAVRRGEPLAMLLFGMCGTLVLIAPLGTAATLGFTIFGAGLTLVAAKEHTETVDATERVIDVEAKVVRQRGRSPYAERLHSGGGS
jgi:hypothetical protein